MIKRLVVEKLYDRFDFDLTFNEDLNLLTGRNGSGKTTLMKIMWGMLSGRIGDEAKYPRVENIILDVAEGTIFQGTSIRSNELFNDNASMSLEFTARWLRDRGGAIRESGDRAIFSQKDILSQFFPSLGRSLFFPTFRRNEGGYEFLKVPPPVVRSPLADDDLSKMIRGASNGPIDYHVFINYNSTNDIDFILASLQATIASQIQKVEKEQGDFVLELTANVQGNERAIIQAIRRKQEDTNAMVATLMRPISKLSEMISILFKSKGIQVSSNLLLGDNLDAIHSDHLSAGEKQMLSFLAYCSICKNTIIFIDEPELSLHADWQRLFLPMLMEIRNGNQYFMATHSPFIYAMYPDKDIDLDKPSGGV